MMSKQIFYYHFKCFNLWLLFNCLLSALCAYCLYKAPYLLYWGQTSVIIAAILFSWFAWIYKYVFKHPVAVITDEDIKIDHNAPLKWHDISHTEEKEIRCCGKKRKILSLHPKSNIDYKYNWLQKHNAGFGPFSIPLYGILKSEDEEKIRRIIQQKLRK